MLDSLATVTVYADNPAGRLHQLLSAFRNADGDGQQFARLLRVAYDDDALMRSFAQVFALPDDIRSQIGKVDEDNYDPDLAMRWSTDLGKVFGATIFFGEKNPNSPTFSEFLASLEYCSFVLHKFLPSRMPSESELEKLKGLISDLLNQLQSDSSIDSDLREFMLDHATAMEYALNDLTARGIVPLEEAFDRAVGALNRRMDITVRAEANPGVWKRFGDLLVAVAAVLQISTSAFVLPGQVRQAIEGPQPTQVEVVAQKPQAAPGTPGSVRPNNTSEQSSKRSPKGKANPTPQG